MEMLDKYLNPDRILTYIEAITITKKEYTMLKEYGQIEREQFEKETGISLDENSIAIRVLIKEMENKSYGNLDTLKKEIVLANAILKDDKKIAAILTENGFSYNHLKEIIRIRGLIKRFMVNGKPFSEELSNEFNTYKSIVIKLIDIFNINFGCNDSTVILNKICEMLITCPELFETRPKTRIK